MGGTLRGFLRLFLVTGVFFLEPLHASCHIHDLLLPRHEGMALGTDFGLDVLAGGSRLDHVPANAGNGGFFIFRMNAFFHNRPFFSSDGLSRPLEESIGNLAPRAVKQYIYNDLHVKSSSF
jgi:hypothetical protein